jgi:two-component system chemotaxis response regulator CheB
MGNKIKVLIVDDSALVRKMVSDALKRDPQIEVVGTAVDPYDAKDKILQLKPDVITLDIEMPKMDGLTFLQLLMEQHPMPVIVMSTLSQAGSDYALKALELGALDVLGKPSGTMSMLEFSDQIADKIKAVLGFNQKSAFAKTPAAAKKPSKLHPPVVKQPLTQSIYNPRQIILIGASTGGTEALKQALVPLPRDMPGICIVQHIPAYFSKCFAGRLNEICQIEVREAVDGDVVKPGLALVAPGDFHMTLSWRMDKYIVNLKKGPTVWHQRPAVDILFDTAADYVEGPNTVAAIFTGMGRDGADGMLKLKQKGAYTMAQSEETCVVYGMPRVAREIGAADHEFDLNDFPQILQKVVTRMKSQQTA